jgi:hypothetical protein
MIAPILCMLVLDLLELRHSLTFSLSKLHPKDEMEVGYLVKYSVSLDFCVVQENGNKYVEVH